MSTPVSSTNKTDRHDIAEILLKVALNTLNQTKTLCSSISILSFKVCPLFCNIKIHDGPMEQQNKGYTVNESF
jgi:hypothetical protein